MEYAYATCLLNESGEEINETNLAAVLDAAGCQVRESRVKAIVAALEDVDVGGVTDVDLDDVGSDSKHDGGPPERQTESHAEQNQNAGSATGATSASELTAIETAPDAADRAGDTAGRADDEASRTDDAHEALSNAADGNSTGAEFEPSGRSNPDDEV